MLTAYPSLNDAEFAEACKALEQRCYDNLSGTNWLSIHWHGSELEIKQMKPATNGETEAIPQSGAEVDPEEALAENDNVSIVTRHTSVEQASTAVDFSILLSPTYRVPVLWFTLASTKAARVQDLEDIYSRVVAPGAHEALRGIGVMGGISIAVSRLSAMLPTFFIHPCNTAEALAALNDGSDLSSFEYLLLWFGIVASGVGLHIPSQIAM